MVAVGMFEHVGVPNYARFFQKIGDLLSADGVALVHSIGRSNGPAIASAWTRKYIFPGAHIPAHDSSDAGAGDLTHVLRRSTEPAPESGRTQTDVNDPERC